MAKAKDKLAGTVVSVFGPFASRALVEMPVDVAAELFDGDVRGARPTNVIDAVRRDLGNLPEPLATSALAATALTLGYELEDPYNSATSKSMCARVLTDVLEQLRVLAPAKEEGDSLDDLAARRAARLAGTPAAADSSRP